MKQLKEIMERLGYTDQEIASTVEYAEQCDLGEKLEKAFTDFFSKELKSDSNDTTTTTIES